MTITLPHLRSRSFALFGSATLLLASAVTTPRQANAQASTTASKSADIAVFAGFVGAHPDYGPFNTYGVMFGGDYTRYLRFPVVPSFEFRANLHSNYAVSEHTYLVGFRAVVPLRRLQPYADFLVGPGTIHFPYNPGYTGDNSTVYSYGGGVDVPVFYNFAIRADLQGQHWNTGEFTYTPSLATIGVRYTIPFRPRVSQRDLGR